MALKTNFASVKTRQDKAHKKKGGGGVVWPLPSLCLSQDKMRFVVKEKKQKKTRQVMCSVVLPGFFIYAVSNVSPPAVFLS